MSAETYRRRLLIGLCLLVAFAISLPIVVVGGVYVLCGGRINGECGIVGFLIIMFVAMPALAAILVFFAVTVVKDRRQAHLGTTVADWLQHVRRPAADGVR